jgi:hypothetical protein
MCAAGIAVKLRGYQALAIPAKLGLVVANVAHPQLLRCWALAFGIRHRRVKPTGIA